MELPEGTRYLCHNHAKEYGTLLEGWRLQKEMCGVCGLTCYCIPILYVSDRTYDPASIQK